jgi:murein L,D-transpeptidase YafK
VFLNFIAQLPQNQGIKIIYTSFFRSFESLYSSILKRLFAFFCLATPLFSIAQDFWSSQLQYPRVASAYKIKKETIEQKLKSAGVTAKNLHVFFRAFKQEKQLEIWVANSANGPYQLFEQFDVCAASGTLGPKVKQGDLQVPEGVYFIDRFNPQSSFHLSLGINYPNALDRKRSGTANPGGDIFIHGNCASIGCLAITDTYINEVYILAVMAKNGGQSKIPVHIFPFRMNNQAMLLVNRMKANNQWKTFWENLAEIYGYFEEHSKPGKWISNNSGKYALSK